MLDKIRHTTPLYDRTLLGETRERVRKENGVTIPPPWIFRTIKHDFDLDEEGALLHWRKNKTVYGKHVEWFTLHEWFVEEALMFL